MMNGNHKEQERKLYTLQNFQVIIVVFGRGGAEMRSSGDGGRRAGTRLVPDLQSTSYNSVIIIIIITITQK